MAAQANKPFKILTGRMFPKFVLEQHPNIITFMENVFGYMDQEGGQYDVAKNLLEYNDVDATLTKFEKVFKKQYLINFPDSLATDVDLLVKTIRSFYLNKGTEASFKFLFSALFNTTVNFKYPKFNILRASDGIWFTPEYLIIADTNDVIPPQKTGGGDYNIAKLVGNFVVGVTSGAVGFVEAVVSLGDEGLDYAGLTTTKAATIVQKEGTFVAGEQIIIGDTLVQNGDFSNGLNFWSLSPADDLDITVASDQVTLTQTTGDVQDKYIYQAVPVEEGKSYWVRVSLIAADAPARVRIGYAAGAAELHASADLQPSAPIVISKLVGPIAAGKTELYISIFNEGVTAGLFTTYDGISAIEENTATAPVLKIADRTSRAFTDLGFVDSNPDTITTTIGDFSTLLGNAQNLVITGSPGNNFTYLVDTVAATTITLDGGEAIVVEGPVSGTLSVLENGVKSGTAKWQDTRGFVSQGDKANNNEMYLQDNDYYQEYSYELTTEVSVDRYRALVKDLLHPAGFKLFGKVTSGDNLETYALRESNYYNDLTFDETAKTVTRVSSGRPWNSLFNPRDKVTISGSLQNDGEYVVDTSVPPSATVLTFESTGTTLVDEPPSTILIGVSSGVGIVDLSETEGALISYSIDIEYAFPLKLEANVDYDIDYESMLTFGRTWAQAEAAREVDGVMIYEWSQLQVGDFDVLAADRFPYIPSFEIDISAIVDVNYFTEVAKLDCLEMFYKFDEPSGTCADSSGNGRDLDVITNAPTYGVPSIIPSQTETCVSWGSISDELQSTVNGPSSSNGDNDWSFACWIAGGDNGTQVAEAPLIELTTGGNSILISIAEGKWFNVYQGGVQKELLWNSGTDLNYISFPYAAFYVIVHVAASNRFDLYMNGKLLTTENTYTTNQGAETPSIIKFKGGQTNDLGFKSMQGAVWTCDQLTAGEILALYYAGVSGNVGGPVA